MFGLFANEQCSFFNRPWQLTLFQMLLCIHVKKQMCVRLQKEYIFACIYVCTESVWLGAMPACKWQHPLSLAHLCLIDWMAQRESITAITLVICQSCWAVKERISHSHASSVFAHLPSSTFSSSSSHVNQWLAQNREMSPLFPSPGLCGAPQEDGTHSRHSPEATVAPHHQRSPGSHRRGREGHPVAWKHSSTPRLSMAILYYLQFSL